MNKNYIYSLIMAIALVPTISFAGRREREDRKAGEQVGGQKKAKVKKNQQPVSAAGVLPEDLQNFHDFEYSITPTMSSVMCQLMDENPLPTLSLEQMAELREATQAVKDNGLPRNLEIQTVEEAGDGVFLSANAEPLPAGTVLGLYLGQLAMMTNAEHDALRGREIAYLYDLHGPLGLNKHEFNNLKYEGYITTNDPWNYDSDFYLVVDGLAEGNWTRLVNSGSKSANVETVLCDITLKGQRLSALVVITKKKIWPGRQLLLDYGSKYWKALGVKARPMKPNTYVLDDT
jgi:hypothetical protein